MICFISQYLRQKDLVQHLCQSIHSRSRRPSGAMVKSADTGVGARDNAGAGPRSTAAPPIRTEQTNAALSFDSDACRQYNAARCLIPDRYDQAISPPAATLHGIPAGRQSHPRVREAATDFVPAPTSSAGRETQRRVCLPALFASIVREVSR